MSLTHQETHHFRNWLEESKVKSCTACGSSDWEVGEILTSEVMGQRSIDLSKASQLMMQRICVDCGHVMLFDARRVGLR